MSAIPKQTNTIPEELVHAYIDANLALVPIPLGIGGNYQKGPTGPDAKAWNIACNAVCDVGNIAKVTEHPSVGLAHVSSRTCAIDVDDCQTAVEWFNEYGVDLQQLLGASDAVQIVSGKENRAKLIYQLPDSIEPQSLTRVTGPSGCVEFRCADKKGRTMQDVLPPSIHPETGNPYEWKGDYKELPTLPESVLSLWQKLLDDSENGNLTNPLDVVIGSDPVLKRLKELNMVLRDCGGGKHDITCPFEEEHTTTGGAVDTAYFAPHTNGYPTGNFSCMHSHCAERKQAEFVQKLGISKNEKELKPSPIEWLSDIKVYLTDKWVIAGLLPRSGLATIYGKPGSGKTFLAIDLACHIAAGLPWAGRKVEKGAVIYIAAENPRSIMNRCALWRDVKKVDPVPPFGVIPKTLNLRDPNADLPDLIAWLSATEEHSGRVACIVVDTLARVMPGGDENTAQDMGVVIGVCDQIRDKFDTLVILIHHSGKDQKAGPRGSSALTGGVDTEIEVLKDTSGHHVLVRKQRDGNEDVQIDFDLDVHKLGEDQDGQEVTSCLVRDAVFVGQTGGSSKLNKREQSVMERLEGLLSATETTANAEAIAAGAETGQVVCEREKLVAELKTIPLSEHSEDANRMAVNRAIASLAKKEKIGLSENYVWLSEHIEH